MLQKINMMSRLLPNEEQFENGDLIQFDSPDGEEHFIGKVYDFAIGDQGTKYHVVRHDGSKYEVTRKDHPILVIRAKPGT